MNAMSSTSDGGSVLTLLWASDYDLANMTQAMDFLTQMLDDSILQYDGKTYAQRFWYGAVAVIGIAAVYNMCFRAAAKFRYDCAGQHSIFDANSLKATSCSSWAVKSSGNNLIPGPLMGTYLGHRAQSIVSAVYTGEGTVLDPGAANWHNYSHSGLSGIHTCTRIR
jgi:hypothetical protein